MELSWFLELYQVTIEGEVISLRSGKPIKQHVKKHGYKEVVLCREGKRTYQLVHRLVALCYVGNPENFPDVNHIDCDRWNNHPSNLEWVTKTQNNQRRSVNKLTEESVQEIKVLWKTGQFTQSEIANKYNVHQAHISRVLNNERWV